MVALQAGENFVIISDLVFMQWPYKVTHLRDTCRVFGSPLLPLAGELQLVELGVDLERAILYVHRIRTELICLVREYWQSKNLVSSRAEAAPI